MWPRAARRSHFSVAVHSSSSRLRRRFAPVVALFLKRRHFRLFDGIKTLSLHAAPKSAAKKRMTFCTRGIKRLSAGVKRRQQLKR